MSTWSQLTDELSACERQISAIRIKARDKIQREEEKVWMVAQKRQELVSEHARSTEEAIRANEEQLRCVETRTDQEISAILLAKEKADARQNIAEAKTSEADAKAVQLMGKTTLLQSLLEQVQIEHDRKFQEIRDNADEKVVEKLEVTNKQIRATGVFASQVQDSALNSIDIMQGKAKSRIREADVGAEWRSRFKDLCDLSMDHSGQELSDEHFETRKNELIKDWIWEWSTLNANNTALPNIPGKDRRQPTEPPLRSVGDVLSAAEVHTRMMHENKIPYKDLNRQKERSMIQAGKDMKLGRRTDGQRRLTYGRSC